MRRLVSLVLPFAALLALSLPLAARADNLETISFTFTSFNGGSGGSGSFTVDYDNYTTGGIVGSDPGYYQVTDLSYSLILPGGSTVGNAYTNGNFNSGDTVGFEQSAYGPFLTLWFESSVDPLYLYSDGGPSYQFAGSDFDYGGVTYGDYNGPPSVSATPEAGSLALLGTGLLGTAGIVRRRPRA